MRSIFIFIIVSLFSVSCNLVDQNKEDMQNETFDNDTIEAETSISEAVPINIDKAIVCDIVISKALKDKGLKAGQYFVGQDSIGKRNNVLRLFLDFEKDLNATLSTSYYNSKGIFKRKVEIEIQGVPGDSKYYDLIFDKNTHIEENSKIKIE